MKLSETLYTECIRVGSTADDKAMVLCEIASLAKQSKVLNNVSEDAILEALQERETLGATAFGHRIAIPHCRMKGVRDFVVGLLTVPNGVEFESEDTQKVHLIVFIIAPKAENSAHVRLLSAISQALQDDAVVRDMVNASDAKTLQSLFLTSAGAEVEERVPVARNLINIFIQDELVCREVLETLSTLEGLSLSVLDGCSCQSYLNQPAAKDTSVTNSNSKCIVAIVERRLSNEVIRRVETITGSLLERTGVMVAIQELAYAGGSLEM